MPAGAPSSATGGLSASNSDIANNNNNHSKCGPTTITTTLTSSGYHRHSYKLSDTSSSSLSNTSTSLKPPSFTTVTNNGHHSKLLHIPPPSDSNNNNFLAAPSPDVVTRRQASLRSATAAGNLHQQCTRRTLRNINAIRFLRSIKLDGEPNAFTEADEQPNQPNQQSSLQQNLLIPCPQNLSESGENENKNILLIQQHQHLQKKTSFGLPQISDLSGSGSSPPNPAGVVEMDVETGGDVFNINNSNNGDGNKIPLKLFSVNERDVNLCLGGEEITRRTSSRAGTTTPFDNNQSSNQQVGSFSSSESPTKQTDLPALAASGSTAINIIPPTPLQQSGSGGETRQQKQPDNTNEDDDDSMPFFASAEDISPTSTRSPRRPSGGQPGVDYSRFHHSHHQNYHYQPYQSSMSRSPPRASRADAVRTSDQVRFKHPRDEDVRFEVGDQDISSKSFRLRHASQRDTTLAGPGLSGPGFGSLFQDETRESREISFSDLLVVTANALCRSFTDAQQHPHHSQQQQQQQQQPQQTALLVLATHGTSSIKPRIQGEVEVRLYEYDPEKLDSPTFLQSVNRCPVVMPSYSVTVLGYYDPSSAKKLLNDQFKERFPDIQLTFTKMRSLKREMKKIALKCHLDLWCIAQSYVFFEKLILKHYIKKPNRKMCAGSCLLLSAKLNDIRKTKIPSLIQEIESTFRIDREDLFTCEFNVFLALDFTLMIPDCEVIPHLIRLIEQQHQAGGASFSFSSSTSSAALHPSANFAMLQQHMQQHVHARPSVAAPTPNASVIQTNSGNNGSGASNTSTALVPSSTSNCSLIIGKSYNNNNDVTN